MPPYLQQWGWTTSSEDFLHYWFTREHVIDEALLNYIQELRRQGLLCYLATQQEQYRTAYILEQMGFGEAFDGMFSSAHIGYMKTNPAFFRAILSKLQVANAGEVLFWDDSLRNVTVAREVGLQAEYYTTYAAFIEKMERYQLAY